jgi:prepilin-type N-terminal cleavage/methylation domain-containing protein
MDVRGKRQDGLEGGFSLLELMFAITILVIGVMGAFTTQLGSLGVITAGQETSKATMELQAAMESLLVSDPDDMVVDFPADVPIPAFTDRNLRNELMVPSYPNWDGIGPIPSSLDVRLTLTWDDFEGRQRSLRLNTAVTR